MKLQKIKIIWRLLLLLIFAIVLTGGQKAIAKPITVTREYTYRASEADSKLTSRTIAMEQVKRLLLEELGTYLISHTEVKDSTLTKDEIVTFTSGWVATVVINEKWNGEDYFLKAKITADADEVSKAIALMHDDSDKGAELKRLRDQNCASLKEIERLRQELVKAKLSTTPNNTENTEAVQKNYDLAVAKLVPSQGIKTEFDGSWAVSLICEDVKIKGRLVSGYEHNFLVDVKNGKLIGGYGQPGQPSSLTMIGIIKTDGTISLNAQGWTGKDKKFVAGPTDKPFSYRMHGKLTQNSGKATRIEVRPCEATFSKL